MLGLVGPYVYRCDRCGDESDPLSRSQLETVRSEHRRRFHGGLRPDGERVITPERMRLTELPTEQRVAALVLALIILFIWLT